MKQNKNVVRLTESQLKQIVAESVANVLNEIDWRGLSQDEWDTFSREVNDIHDSDYDDYESNEEDFDTPSNVQKDIIYDIKNGYFDHKILNKTFAEDVAYYCHHYGCDRKTLLKAAEERYNIITQ